MPYRYSAAFSHLLLAGTAAYCHFKFSDALATCGLCVKLPCISFAVIAINSALGVWRFGNPDHGEEVADLYMITESIQGIVALPLIVTELWLRYDYQKELAYLHGLVAVIPVTLRLAEKDAKEVTDFMVAVNCTSLGVISYLNQCYSGVGAAVVYLYSYFLLKQIHAANEEESVLEWYNYGLCFFCYFALSALETAVAFETKSGGSSCR